MSDSLTTTVERSEAHGIPDASNGQREGCSLHGIVGLCACGCGTELHKNSKGKMPLYAFNHHHRGKKHSKEWSEKQAAGVKKAWSDGQYETTMRHQSAELIENRASKNRGKKRTPEFCEQMKAIAENAHARGDYAGEQTRQKYRDNLIARIKQNPKLYGQSREWMIAIQSKRDMVKLAADNSKKLTEQMHEWKESGQLDAIRRKAGNAKDMPDHLAAKVWRIRDPNGNVHFFSNLSSWARKHEHLFEDCAPASKSPHWLRIAGGIADLLNAKGRSCSYRGWVAVSKTELEEGAPDMLARNTQPNAPGERPGGKQSENMKTSELKACPFCGGKGILKDTDNKDHWHIECERCGARRADTWLETSDATESWNDRAGGQQPKAAPNAELKPVRFGELLDGLRQVLGSIQKEKRDAFLNGYSFEEWLAYQQEDAILGAIGVVYDRSKREPSNADISDRR